jgi:hypothetical protein
MESHQTSDALLAHFDRPKKLELFDFEWDEGALPRERELVSETRPAVVDLGIEPCVEAPRIARRGIGWALAWGAAVAVVAVAGSVLIQLAYVLAAEHALSIAAHAGAMEATLPRATPQSVTASVERRLARYPSLVKQLQLTLLQNDSPARSPLRQHEGDRFSVTLSAPSSSAVPEWLRSLAMWQRDADIQAQAEKLVPGRMLQREAKLAGVPK